MKKYGLWLYALPAAIILMIYFWLQGSGNFSLQFIPPLDLALRYTWICLWVLGLASFIFRTAKLLALGVTEESRRKNSKVSFAPYSFMFVTLAVVVLFPMTVGVGIAIASEAKTPYEKSEDGTAYLVPPAPHIPEKRIYPIRGGIFIETQPLLPPPGQESPSAGPSATPEPTASTEPTASSSL